MLFNNQTWHKSLLILLAKNNSYHNILFC